VNIVRSCVATVTVIVLATAGCSRRNTNVVPPRLGEPSGAASVAGIYRTTQGSILQLRADGRFFLLAGAGPIDGRFALDHGSFTARGGRCGTSPGRYRVRVTGESRPNKARLEFTVVDDGCAARRDPLLDQRWVYVES
jgi:hypothetical protein